uniref:Small ribosomal subunit protein uS15c n=1 Tax=Chlamydomonas leiostraca TaxID=1034604 RepID=A0A7S0RZC4_9CHLO
MAWMSTVSQPSLNATTSEDASRASSSADASTSGSDMGSPRGDLIQQYLALHNESHKKQFTSHKNDIIKQFQRHPGDVGSPEVTVAIWTHFLREQTKHFDQVPKHNAVMRHCEFIANKRRKLLAWMRRDQFASYAMCIQKLGLADVFGQQTLADRYRVGIPHKIEDKDEGTRRRRFAFHRQYVQKKTSQWKRFRPQLMYEDPLLPPPPAAATAGAVGPRSTALE